MKLTSMVVIKHGHMVNEVVSSKHNGWLEINLILFLCVLKTSPEAAFTHMSIYK